MIKRAQAESEFESIYLADDQMQMSEMSFFNSFTYEGDDYMEDDLDHIIEQAFSKQATNSNKLSIRKNVLQKSSANLASYEEDISTHLETKQDILSDLDDQLSLQALDTFYSDVSRDSNINKGQEEQKKINEAFLRCIKNKKNDRILKMLSPQVNKGLLDVHYKNSQGMDSMLMCCQTGNLDILKILVNDFNANVQVINSIDRRVGLHYACMYNAPSVLSFLLGKNSTLKNFQDYQGCTPLYYAALNNYEKCVDVMLTNEANTALANALGLTAIEVTTSLNIQKQLEKKMAQNSNISSVETYKRTPIGNSQKLSCNSRKDEVIKLMQKAQAEQARLSPEKQIKMENCCCKWWVKQKQGAFINPIQQARQESLKNHFNSWTANVKEDIKQQNESAKRCKIYLEKLQKMNQPVKVKRKVKFEDFIVYRQIGEGAFGEVYLVKLKQGILEDKKKEEPETVESSEEKQEILTEEEDEERRLALRLKKLHRGGYNDEEENPSQMYYALKIINKTALKKRKIAEYIVSEKNVMQEVHHPFVAKMHFTFQDESHLFILMDFYPGGDLGRILEKEMELEEMQVKVWAAQIVLALEELHNKDIIYRDLKPENVVLDAKGNLHLIDFGLAKKGADTISRSFCGTPIYLPPEIIGRQGHNKMVDWYSLGVIIYELLVGRPPYFSKDCKQLFKDIQTQPLRIPKTLPEDAKSLLIQLLRKNYKLRLGFHGDAQEIKQHPWFSNINWERVYSKQYTCLKPLVLSIPSVPIQIILKPSRQSQIGQVEHKWSFFHFADEAHQEDSTPKDSSLSQNNENI